MKNIKPNTSAPTAQDDPRAVRVNISMPPIVRAIADQVCSSKGFAGLSDYVQAYLRRDAAYLGLDQFQLACPSCRPVTHPDLTLGIAG